MDRFTTILISVTVATSALYAKANEAAAVAAAADATF